MKFKDIDLSDVNFTQEEFQSTEETYNNSKLLMTHISRLEYMENQKEKAREKYLNISNVADTLNQDILRLSDNITLTKVYYNKYKTSKMEKLQNVISQLIEIYFKDKHNFKLESSVSRGKSQVQLISLNKNGESAGSIEHITSDAEQQLIGYTLLKLTLNELGSNFMLLDEPFSSFGVDEVKEVPNMLMSNEDFQQVLIEHKDELLNALEDYKEKMIIYNLKKEEEESLIIDSIENENNLLQWNNLLPKTIDTIRKEYL